MCLWLTQQTNLNLTLIQDNHNFPGKQVKSPWLMGCGNFAHSQCLAEMLLCACRKQAESQPLTETSANQAEALLSALSSLEIGSLYYDKYIVDQGQRRGINSIIAYARVKENPTQEACPCSLYPSHCIIEGSAKQYSMLTLRRWAEHGPFRPSALTLFGALGMINLFGWQWYIGSLKAFPRDIPMHLQVILERIVLETWSFWLTEVWRTRGTWLMIFRTARWLIERCAGGDQVLAWPWPLQAWASVLREPPSLGGWGSCSLHPSHAGRLLWQPGDRHLRWWCHPTLPGAGERQLHPRGKELSVHVCLAALLS